MQNLFDWLLNLTQVFAQFSTMLTEPLQYLNMSPLEIFSVGGLMAVLTIHIIRLVLG